MFQHSPACEEDWRRGHPRQQMLPALRSRCSPTSPFGTDTAAPRQASWALVSLQSPDCSLIIRGGVTPTL